MWRITQQLTKLTLSANTKLGNPGVHTIPSASITTCSARHLCGSNTIALTRHTQGITGTQPNGSSILSRSKPIFSSPHPCLTTPSRQMATLEQMHRKGPPKKTRFNKKKTALDGSPQKKGIVLKVIIKKPKKPNSANRKCVRVKLSNGKQIVAFIPGEGHNLQEHNMVLVEGGGRQDLPGVKHSVVRGKYDSIVSRLGTRQMSEGPASKISRMMMKIGTHNGTFHCDEVLACYMLRQLPEYKDAEIIRTRDPALLQTCDIVVDVGGVYDPSKHRYDHHQRSFTDSMNSLNPDKKWVTKLSSAGLIYLHFGERILAQKLKRPDSDRFTKIIFDKIYQHFMEEVDAIDNGINQTDEKPRYSISTSLSSRVGHFNPRWNEESSEEDTKVRFYKAMALVGTEFEDRVSFYRDGWWPARQLVETALQKRFEVDPSGEIMKFEEGGCPWKDHLLTMEEEQVFDPQVKFILYPDQNKAWRIQCVPKERNTFENRLSLLKEWCGIRDEELSKLSGIPGCIFVHANGFIGGNKSYDGALEMARRTLANKPTL